MTTPQIELRPLTSLRGYDKNARTHSPEQVAQIAASITEYGFTNPLLIAPDGEIIAGHGRFAAADLLGLAEAPCIVLAHLTPAQRRAYVIADNQLALGAGWDNDLLRAELEAIAADGLDLESLGFGADALAELLNPPTKGQADPDDVPDEPETPTSALGDVWLMGGHRLACGDSTDPDAVAQALGGASPHLMVTDPPYGVEYAANWRDASLGGKSGGRAVGKVRNDDRADWSAAWALFHGDVAYVWHGQLQGPVVAASLEGQGLVLRYQLVWAKSQFVIGRGHYHPQYEACWYAVRKGGTGHWQGDRKQSTLWQIDKPKKSETGHSTQKPVECMRRPIENNSKPGDAVYEPFSGSGTTIIAAEMTGRRCLAIELSPAYVDVAVLRWETYSGRTATLEQTGQTFRQVADERALARNRAAE